MTIRRTPADFIVEERVSEAFRGALRPSRDRDAIHAVFELRKESLTTPEAIGYFAKSIGVRPGEVGFAGLKDKHAQTAQWVAAKVKAVPTNEVADQRWSASFRGWSTRELSADAIDGNRFTIVVRDLSRDSSQEMKRRASLLTSERHAETGLPDRSSDGADAQKGSRCCSGTTTTASPEGRQGTTTTGQPPEGTTTTTEVTHPAARTLLVVNYFGDQRFGSARHGKGFAAKPLIAGDFEGALKLLIATPARKDTGKMRVFTRLAATHWGDWKKLAEELPRCPERRPIETLAAGGSFADAFAALPAFTQQMSVEAFQSHLWNGAARRIGESLAGIETKHLLRAPDDFGEMVFPIARVVDEAWRSVDMPILGKSSVLAEPWGPFAAEAMSEAGIASCAELKIPELRRPYFGEAPRSLFVRAGEFTLSAGEPDEMSAKSKRLKRTVRFDLPRGAYATVVLRAIGQ